MSPKLNFAEFIQGLFQDSRRKIEKNASKSTELFTNKMLMYLTNTFRHYANTSDTDAWMLTNTLFGITQIHKFFVFNFFHFEYILNSFTLFNQGFGIC